MYLTEEILDKLNTRLNGKKTGTPPVTLPDIMVRSFAEVKTLAGDSLSWGEKNHLWQQAQKELKENRMAESRILSRANPQLANAVRLGIRQSAMLRSYDDLFPARAGSFVKPGSVASMFSPAGYLTELYREARNLHADTSQYHLGKRRPDLASLPLSQGNMDDELSTLSLSNELLLNSIETAESLDYDGVMEMLSTYRQTGMTPFHLPYEAVRQSILLQDPEFGAFRRNPSVAASMDAASLLGIVSDISPELREILTEEITDSNADDLIKKNFGEINVEAFQSPAYLARYYGLTYDEVTSLLGMVTTNTYSAGVQYYQNDQLISLLESDGALNAVLITREAAENYKQFGYAELLPVTKNEYIFNLTIKSTAGTGSFFVGTKGVGSKDIFNSTHFNNENNVPLSFPVTLDKNTVKINVTRRNGGYNASVKFSITDYSINVYLLKLNKLIRLYKATGLPPSYIRTVIESSNNDLTITADVLSQLFWVSHYMQRYGIDPSAALVLSGADISQISHSGEGSAFNRLFNTPWLNNTEFAADGAELDLTPGGAVDTFRSGVLKRAFQVNDTELFTLWSLAQGSASPGPFTATAGNLSMLYRVKLLADVHGLRVTELAALLSVSPYAASGIATISQTETELAGLVSFLDQYTRWLKGEGWTVSDLYLMTTDRYSTALSPDIENLVTTLKDGLANQDLSQAGDAGLIRAAAPFIAAATRLDSADTATALLQWLDQLEPQGLTVKDFLAKVAEFTPDGDNGALVSFCQVLGQLALIVRGLRLTTGEIALAVTPSGKLLPDSQTLPQDIATIRALARFHHWLQQCGASATEILSALGSGTLTPAQLAQAMMLDEQMVTQGLAEVDKEASLFGSWMEIDITLQWVDMAATLGITPTEVRTLMNVKFAGGVNPTTWSDWVDLSNTLQAGLSSRQTTQLQATLEEAVSTATSAYVIKNIAPSSARVTNRDQLYSWLLIDNQVSAQIKTTRIAEAIASVQLYVNRALNGQEDEGVDNKVKSKTFFTRDWDTYNKRYSTWAGVSELVYYPENYTDPTMRIGQTGMMDEMLQTLSQSQLSSDTVEDAFKTYMTRFEEIANLDIISGYHDSVSDQKGTTYLVGRSAVGDYYWRSTDIGKMADGKLPANAWTEWKKITAAITPVSNLVRPVIFLSRLYLVWVESREVSAGNGSDTKKIPEYSLKYAHILHDGTWGAPVTIKPETGILPPTNVDIADTGMYCARDTGQEQLYIFFYQKESSYDGIPKAIAGLNIFSDGSTRSITSDVSTETAGYIYLQIDTTTAVRLNTPYAGGETRVSVSDPVRVDSQWGDGNFTLMSGGGADITATLKDSNVTLHFSATSRVIYSPDSGGRDKAHTVPILLDRGSIDKSYAYAAQRDYDGDYLYDTLGLLVSNTSPREAWIRDGMMPTYCSVSINNNTGFSAVNINKRIDWTARFIEESLSNIRISYAGDSDYRPDLYVYKYSDFRTIKTTIETSQVKVSVRAGSEETQSAGSADQRSKYSLEESLFQFKDKSITFPLSIFSGNTADIDFVFSTTGSAGDSRPSLGSETFSLTLTRVVSSTLPVITLNRTDTFAQYLQYGVHRIRVNTLFAKKLVARAKAGLDTILSWDTQHIAEPKLGTGSYIEVNLPAYNASEHGDDRRASLQVANNHTGAPDKVRHTYWSGVLTDKPLTARIFIATAQVPGVMQFPYDRKYGLDLFLSCAKSAYLQGTFKDIPPDLSLTSFTASSDHSPTRDVVVRALSDTTEPMDFSGANALYFWEMFYYVPMMVFKRLLSESRFTEATQWIQYIWSPDGYLVYDQPATYQWNVRPLQEETTWHASPLESVDPDAVSQADPLHYKVATFMAYLDLLIARGDMAYRQLERDTLNEAKMWYVQALGILGDEPYLTQNTAWTSPRLTDAADETTQKTVQQALLAVRQLTATGELGTANSLTSLFLPQQNEKLAGYWQTLAQRLYNLRHNLSIDGNPLSLSVYAAPADPAALLSAAVNAASGGAGLPTVDDIPLYRFPNLLESARGLVSQLTQFGSTLLSITERQDAEALSELLQTQGSELVLQGIAQQMKTLEEFDADKAALEEIRRGAQSRLESYSRLHEEDVNTGERQAMDLALSASVLSATATTSYTIAAGMDAVPNIYGVAFGGSRYGSIARAVGTGIEVVASATRAAADRISQSEMYRRRRQEWDIQRNAAQSDVKQLDAQLASLAVRREAALLQKTYLETQQSQTQAQMTFLQNKFSNKALYNWLRGRLSAIYYQFYDLTVSRCLMAQKAYQWALNNKNEFIRPGTWQGSYAGLMAGETLMLNLVQMEQEYLKKDEREKEVTRTVCLSEFYASLPEDDFVLADQVVALVTGTPGEAGSGENMLKLQDSQLQATLKLADLKIGADYPVSLGNTRRIKQVSVTLPALVGPYQDVRAVLSYGGSVVMPRGCDALAVSHGMNDSGQFQLDFNDSRWLPFEGIRVDDGGTLTLSFPDADDKQKDLLLSLTDIILHIRYTITG